MPLALVRKVDGNVVCAPLEKFSIKYVAIEALQPEPSEHILSSQEQAHYQHQYIFDVKRKPVPGERQGSVGFGNT